MDGRRNVRNVVLLPALVAVLALSFAANAYFFIGIREANEAMEPFGGQPQRYLGVTALRANVQTLVLKWASPTTQSPS